LITQVQNPTSSFSLKNKKDMYLGSAEGKKGAPQYFGHFFQNSRIKTSKKNIRNKYVFAQESFSFVSKIRNP
jgi:hypothetical protein